MAHGSTTAGLMAVAWRAGHRCIPMALTTAAVGQRAFAASVLAEQVAAHSACD